MTARPIDVFLKKNYELIYFKRNFRIKVGRAASEGIDKRDLELLINTWKAKANAMGEPGMLRWQELEKEIPQIVKHNEQVLRGKKIGGIDV